MRPGIPSVAFGIFNLELGSFWFDKEPEESGLNYLECYLWGKMPQKRGWSVFRFQLPESVLWPWVVSVVFWGRWRRYEGTWKVSAILKPTQSLWKSLFLTQAWFGRYLTPMIRHKPIKSSKILLACFFFFFILMVQSQNPGATSAVLNESWWLWYSDALYHRSLPHFPSVAVMNVHKRVN